MELQNRMKHSSETTVARNKIDMMILAAALDSPCAKRFTAAREGEVALLQAKKKYKQNEFVDLHLVVEMVCLLLYTHSRTQRRHTQTLVHKANAKRPTRCVCTKRRLCKVHGIWETGELLALLRPNHCACVIMNELYFLDLTTSNVVRTGRSKWESHTHTHTHSSLTQKKTNARGNCFHLLAAFDRRNTMQYNKNAFDASIVQISGLDWINLNIATLWSTRNDSLADGKWEIGVVVRRLLGVVREIAVLETETARKRRFKLQTRQLPCVAAVPWCITVVHIGTSRRQVLRWIAVVH